MARFELSDDGTMDTVIVDNKTGEEHRFNYEPDYDSGAGEALSDEKAEELYEQYVADCIEQLVEEFGE